MVRQDRRKDPAEGRRRPNAPAATRGWREERERGGA